MSGKKVCYHHGGKSRSGETHGRYDCGIFAEGLHDSEKETWHEIQVSNLDDIIRLLNIQLARAVKKLKEIEDIPVDETGAQPETNLTAFELESIEKTSVANSFGEIDEKKVVKKRPDYRAIIDRITGRIGKLVSIKNDMDNSRAAADNGTLDAMLSKLDESRRRK